ncbi:MAG: putative molybdenum carrier protein [Pirellulales bacterium]|nr:putative molybdenum carrier protein [Pirellulales bacterium]
MLANETGHPFDDEIAFTPVNEVDVAGIQHQKLKIVSGGQTGVDRAALDVAFELGLCHGGWCPAGRKAEDGAIPPQYQLRETNSSEYRERTRRNVLDSDATLLIVAGPLTGGTALTLREAKRLRRPHTVANLFCADDEVSRTIRWLKRQNPLVLNVAGPRASQHPGISHLAQEFLKRVLTGCEDRSRRR